MQNYQNFSRQFNMPFNNQGFRIIPIANENEMNNITVDFSGAPSYFHNQATNEIFVKRFDMQTGITTIQKFVKFEPVQTPINEKKEQENINLYEKEFNSINDRIDGLKSMIEKMNVKEELKGAKNVK